MLLATFRIALAEPDAVTPSNATPETAPAAASASLSASGSSAVHWAGERTQDLLATALSSIGVKYKRGANDPAVGFDCSGFVQHVYRSALGLLLPHNAYSMSLQGRSVGLDELIPGDLVFFHTLKHQFSHVGIYLGENRFIHAPSKGKTVQVDKLDDAYWTKHFTGARRLDTEVAATPPRAE